APPSRSGPTGRASHSPRPDSSERRPATSEPSRRRRRFWIAVGRRGGRLERVTLPGTSRKGVRVKSARLLGAAVVVAVSVGGVGGAGVASAAKVGQQRGPISGRMRTAAGAVTSTNWSGYAAHGATFSDVNGSWQQPSADCTSAPKNTVALSAFWV